MKPRNLYGSAVILGKPLRAVIFSGWLHLGQGCEGGRGSSRPLARLFGLSARLSSSLSVRPSWRGIVQPSSHVRDIQRVSFIPIEVTWICIFGMFPFFSQWLSDRGFDKVLLLRSWISTKKENWNGIGINKMHANILDRRENVSKKYMYTLISDPYIGDYPSISFMW